MGYSKIFLLTVFTIVCISSVLAQGGMMSKIQSRAADTAAGAQAQAQAVAGSGSDSAPTVPVKPATGLPTTFPTNIKDLQAALQQVLLLFSTMIPIQQLLTNLQPQGQ